MHNNDRSIVVLISGNGSNLQAIMDNSANGNYRISGVISNKADAYGLLRAQQSNIATQVIDHKQYASRDLFDNALAKAIDAYNPGLVVLAGFMRILGADFVKHYQGRILNIHPSLLPAYPGTNTHQRVLDAGEKQHGVSVHFVTEELDGGPVIAQESIAIEPTDDADSLAEKIHQKEHILYPTVVSWFADGRLRLDGNDAYLDERLLPESGERLS
ncbi:phosphoribosylglycinamide formyltransferase [Gammaproteobacteria bacterium]|nr:phosphoribosylglycinamide formyltransferase [Gammaproteobacteria bacterium]HAS49206.1 phosphoribosylglycinamide formyltransferase [Gammaproteobacteria bacterium]